MTKKNIGIRPTMLLWCVPPLVAIILLIGFLLNSGSGMKFPREIVLSETTANFEDFPKIKLTGHGAITFWFDDAWKSQYDVAFDILDERHINAALAVPTKLVGFDAYMDWDQVIKLREKGWEITSHSRSHDCSTDNLDFNSLNEEIEGSKKDLEAHGIRTNIYLPPCGITSKISNSLVLYHYEYQRLIEAGFNDIPVEDPFGIKIQEVGRHTTVSDVEKWIRVAQKDNKWLILMFHQIDNDDTRYGIDPVTYRSIVDLVDNSNIQIVLPTQILEKSI
ncbi:polysaccharide deacetylase family protein [Candidatus Woesebacteria bacterium]|nr:MAG: polysaccharide deacetylase family protein [Candidatus Woesebacteria bacterium]